ncbi:MAG: Co2+/Mg2+ efflux protein ApaG [Parvularculaceae bacterium]
MYERITRGIRINVRPNYLEKESDPGDGRFVWSYTVCIHNDSPETVRLRTRYWRIIDSAGLVEEVQGVGVVGEQPTIKPGEGFEYTSGTPLPTPSGLMLGRYLMETAAGERFEAEIPPFSLDSPYERRQLH